MLETLSLEGPKADLSLTLPANRDYYYLRLTQPDGSWAVTAPIWLDEQNHLGISEISLSPTLTAGKPETVTVTLYNAEPQDLTVSHVTLQVGETLYTHTGPLTLLPFTSLPVTFSHTFASDGVCTITAEAAGAYDGANRRFTDSQTVTVLPPELVDDVILLCPEESRTGFSRLMALAEEKDVDLTICTALPDLTTCRLLILTADAPAPEKQAVRDHLLRGGSLLLCGISPEIHPEIIPQLNELLESVGASGRFLPEEARDEISNQGQPHQLRTAVFAQSIWTEALEEGQYFRQDRGCAIDPGAGQWLVKGLETAGSPVLLSAEETESGGWIFLSGGTLFPDGHLPPTDAWALPSGNQTILESLLGLLHSPQPTIPIASLREAEPEHIYLAEGRITAGTANPHTTFPNTVYLEDATGGIAATGYSTHGLPLGSRVQILGVLVRQGENPQLQILRLTELGRESPLLPTPDIPGKDTGGKLLQTAGVVTAFSTRDGVISRFSLDHGVEILVEPEIRSASRGRNELSRIVRAGNTLRAVGLCHHDGENWVLRLRDCDEVTLLSGTPAPVPEENPDPWPPEDPSDSEESLPIEPTDESRPDTEDPAATDPAAPTEDPETGEIPDTGDPIGTHFLAWWISLAGLLSFRKKRK